MSITALVTPEEIANALTVFGAKIAPAFRTAYARQRGVDYAGNINAALNEAIREASGGAIKVNIATFFNPAVQSAGTGTTADPATEKTVSEQLSPDTATNAAAYKGLDIAKASAKDIEEHANGLHVELQGAAEAMRASKATPAQVEEMGRMVKNAMHFYDQVVERADASGDPKEVEALFNHRFRRLASDLPAYETQVDSARIGLERK